MIVVDQVFEFFAGFEVGNLLGSDFHPGARFWISPYARLCQPGLKNAKVAQLNGDVVSQTVGDFIERPLDHIEDFVLDHAGLVTDGDNDVAFG